jgi:hypothetical protein
MQRTSEGTFRPAQTLHPDAARRPSHKEHWSLHIVSSGADSVLQTKESQMADGKWNRGISARRKGAMARKGESFTEMRERSDPPFPPLLKGGNIIGLSAGRKSRNAARDYVGRFCSDQCPQGGRADLARFD